MYNYYTCTYKCISFNRLFVVDFFTFVSKWWLHLHLLFSSCLPSSGETDPAYTYIINIITKRMVTACHRSKLDKTTYVLDDRPFSSLTCHK